MNQSFAPSQPESQEPAGFFQEEKIDWIPAHPSYLKSRLLGLTCGAVLGLVVCLIPLFLNLIFDANLPLWLVYGLPSLSLLWNLFDLLLVTRRVRALGYSEQEDHLLLKYGLLIRKVQAVPYGRMQYVEVNVGPINNLFGLAELELHTASAGMTAHLRGITEEDAKRLRKVLTERGKKKKVAL